MTKITHEIGSDNVFADIGLPNAGEHLVKAQLVVKIDRLMKERGLKQSAAAALFGVRQPDVSCRSRAGCGDRRQARPRQPRAIPARGLNGRRGRPPPPHASALQRRVVIAQINILVRVRQRGAGLAVAGAQLQHGADALDGDFGLGGEP